MGQEVSFQYYIDKSKFGSENQSSVLRSNSTLWLRNVSKLSKFHNLCRAAPVQNVVPPTTPACSCCLKKGRKCPWYDRSMTRTYSVQLMMMIFKTDRKIKIARSNWTQTAKIEWRCIFHPTWKKRSPWEHLIHLDINRQLQKVFANDL